MTPEQIRGLVYMQSCAYYVQAGHAPDICIIDPATLRALEGDPFLIRLPDSSYRLDPGPEYQLRAQLTINRQIMGLRILVVNFPGTLIMVAGAYPQDTRLMIDPSPVEQARGNM